MSSSLHFDLNPITFATAEDDRLRQQLLNQGIQVLTEQEALQGSRPWDIICQDDQRETVLHQLKTFKTLGLGNTYIQGLWRCDQIDLLSERLFALNPAAKTNALLFDLPNSPYLVIEQLLYKFFNLSLLRQNDVAKSHYDLPTELYEGFLGESMKYTTGDWTGLDPVPENLTAAQYQNLDYWCNELEITDGDIILDCGCGWGTLLDYLSPRVNVTYIGITISEVQLDYCRSTFQEFENAYFYNHSYHNRYQDILAASGVDHIKKCIFLETIEHGGTRNWPNILKNVREVISPDGLLGIQTIGADHPNLVCDPYVNRYIFPHASLGSPSELGRAIESDRQFVKCKEHNIAHHYPATLRAWNHLFQQNWEEIQPYIQSILNLTPFQTLDEWKRHWEFYLLLCAGAFVAGTYPQVYQLTAKPNFFSKF
ncbi:class I SAM-dependent methyltransferase [Nodosilinea sp. FACHB-13]|uniref:class I SAM-dependent methyltransferase n=1 Tax=Cyanophyceae TaxID=3028117 RepID=UPI0016870D93|nr:class I SAM-dependent methyltransferase [Nodosilinea sp. FACHB-13]MBD2107885.1 class I SAM-dependent methyltransferase [Nodosilinea sp. FACHB-13]